MMRHNKTTKQIFTIIVFAGAVIACSEKVSQLPLTGDDVADISANVWLHQINMHDYFIYFDAEERGWEAEVENSTKQRSSEIYKKEFTYLIDTIAKQISILMDEDGTERKLKYRLIFDGQRILELNNMQYVDALDEFANFSSRAVNDMIQQQQEYEKMMQNDKLQQQQEYDKIMQEINNN